MAAWIPSLMIICSMSNGASASRYWAAVPGAVIQGENDVIHRSGYSLARCKNECAATSWCKSFDWHGNSASCCLSDKKASDVGGLKHDYRGDPYDHYELAPRTHSAHTAHMTDLADRHQDLDDRHQAMAPSPVTHSVLVG